MDTTPYWIAETSLPRFPRPDADVNVDVVIVGAGITGLTAAYLLKKQGLTVAVLERARCATIDTGHTTAHLTAVVDERYYDLKKRFGKDAARAVWDASGAAIDQITQLIRVEDIACDFRWVPGYLHAPRGDVTEDTLRDLAAEAEAVQELGIRAEREERVPIFAVPGIKFPHQALFHPRKYLAEIARAIPGNGSHLFENAAADEITDAPLAVKSGAYRLRCGHLILATHNPLMGTNGVLSATLFQSKLALYSSYVLGARLPAGQFPEAAFWDTDEPYAYLRVEKKRGYDYAIYGGEDHKTGQAETTREVYARLEQKFLSFAPEATIEHHWSGQVIETNDGLPFIGEMTDRQFVSTGYAGNGMTFGTLGAMMATDYVLQRRNPWADLFDVHRKKLRGGTWSYLTENKDYPYYLVRDWLAKSEGDSTVEVRKGEGKIISLDGRKTAAYRDEQGKMTLCSPVCTHMQCIVGWNDAEKTWDCPCHGSRFKPTGEVISGPAEEPLAPHEHPATTKK